MKRQATDYEEICVNHIFDQWLIYRTYKEFSKLSFKRKEIQLDKGQKIGDISLNNIYECQISTWKNLTSLAFKEMEMKTMMRYHHISIRTTSRKGSHNTKYWLGYGKNGYLHTWLVWILIGKAPLENTLAVS